jgi:1-acyl-sn-glycerol-3-phosphate acyltransferase
LTAVTYALRLAIAVIVRAAMRIYLRFEISGSENVRSSKSLVVVANHSSHLDAVCLTAVFPLRRLRHVFSAAASDYFFQTHLRRSIAALFGNAVPFARGASTRHAMRLCHEVLARSGNILIWFPEGTRSIDGRMQPFRCGVGALVAGRDIDVVPCYLDGTHRAWPKGARMFRPRKVRLIVGARRNYADRRADKPNISAIASELEAAVKQLARRNDFHRTHHEELRRHGAVLSLVDSGQADA